MTFLLEKISVRGQFEVVADEVQSPSDGFSVLKGLRVSDARGVWFCAAELSFSWSASKLLLGQVQIDAITIKQAHLDRLPHAAEEQQAASQASAPSAWPRSPIIVNIPKISIMVMRVSEAIFPQVVTFDANASLRD
jgi:autotransporter translocation and assembly factor TamB